MAIATEIKSAMSEALHRQQGVHPYELTETAYVDDRVAREIKQYERSIESEKGYLEQIKDKVRPKEKEKIEWKIDMWGKQLARLKSGEWKKVNASYLHEQYAKMLKKAISTGQPVPQNIINQAPEYKAAQGARERYEKGWKTSFANRSVAINDQMRQELGYKVKRQDGTPITSGQLEDIAKGVGEVEDVVGPLHDLFDKTDITIVHTSGKHPFLSGFGGTYTSSEKAVNIGVTGVKALGHELGHWLDFESGKAENLSSRIYSKTGGKSHEITSTAESWQGRYKDQKPTALGQLIDEARFKINKMREVRDYMKADYGKDKTAEEKEQIKLVREHLTPYWREPREIWARLVEQYIATKNGKAGLATDSPEHYERQPGWWTKEDFAKMMPQVETLIKGRVKALRGSDVVPPRKTATAEKKLEEFASDVKQIEKTTPVAAAPKLDITEPRTLGGGNMPDIGSADKPVLSPYGLQAYRNDGFWYYRGYSMSGSGELGPWMRVTDPRSQGQYDALYTDKESITKAQVEAEKRAPTVKPKTEPIVIAPGDVITDGLVNGRVIAEGSVRMGREDVPGYQIVITSGHQAGQKSIIPKDQAKLVRHEPARAPETPKPKAEAPTKVETQPTTLHTWSEHRVYSGRKDEFGHLATYKTKEQAEKGAASIKHRWPFYETEAYERYPGTWGVKYRKSPETLAKEAKAKEIGALRPKPGAKQSDRAIAIDRSLLAKQVVTVDDPRWLKRPNRFDVRGVDTPGSHRIIPGVAYADKGAKRLARTRHKGWKRVKFT